MTELSTFARDGAVLGVHTRIAASKARRSCTLTPCLPHNTLETNDCAHPALAGCVLPGAQLPPSAPPTQKVRERLRLIFKSVSWHTAMHAALTAEGRSLQEGERAPCCCRVALPCRLACRAESHSRTLRGRLRALAVHADAASTVQLELGFALSEHGVIHVLSTCKESAHECYLLCSLWGPQSESMAIMFEALLCVGRASHTVCCWPRCAA